MVLRQWDYAWSSCGVRSVPPRLVHSTPHLTDAVSRLAVIGVHGGPYNALARHRIAARCVLRPAPFGAHGATSVADVRGSTADSSRRATSSPAARLAQEIRARRSWPLSKMVGAAPRWEHDHLS